jgi:tetratricopeptide (TPR) repeat protein
MTSSFVFRQVGLLGLVFLVALRAVGSEPEWIEIRSQNFSVVTDTGEGRGRDVALRFEQMRAVYGALMAKAKVNSPIPLQIIAFRNTKEMRQFAPLWKGKPTEVTGLFQASADRGFIMLDMSAEDPWQVVFHEYAHQLLNGNTSAEMQPWFEEGFAEYFSTIKVDGKKADVGLLSDRNMQVLRQTGLIKVADLFRVQHNSSAYNETGDRRSVFYAESWLVVHYLFDNRLLPRMGTYFDLVINHDAPVEQAIQQTFGMSASDFDKVIARYWQGGRYLYYPIPSPTGLDSHSFTAKRMSASDAKAVLADVHLHSPDYGDKAIDEFQEILKVEPDNASALRGLGYAYLMKRDFHHSADYFTQAAAHDSSDPRVFYYSAMLAQMQYGTGFVSDPEQLATMQKALEKSIALDPEFADSYNLLAFTYMSQGSRQLAATTMRKAVLLNPRNQGYALSLAQMDLAIQQFDESLALLKQLSRSSDANIAARASEAMQMVENVKSLSGGTVPVTIESTVSPEGAAASKATSATLAPTIADMRPARFLKGKMIAVDCSAPPKAVLTVKSGATNWTFNVADTAHVAVVGADTFSCQWRNQNVAINYREAAEATGDVISVEIQ